MPRLTCWVGDPDASYTYSGLRNEPVPFPPWLDAVRDAVSEHVGVRFDSVLANLYRDGRDSMGWHSDDEPELGPEPIIASVSLGAVRTFRLRHRQSGATVDYELGHGSLLVMEGDTQHAWKHCLPKRLRVRDPRINLTFRRVRCS